MREQKQQIKKLEWELNRKEKALAEAVRCSCSTKSPCDLRGARGRKIELEKRRAVSTLIEEACAAGGRLGQACQVIDLSPRTLQRWREQGTLKDGARAQAV